MTAYSARREAPSLCHLSNFLPELTDDFFRVADNPEIRLCYGLFSRLA